MSKPLTRDEVETLRIWLMADSPARLHRISKRRIVADMLRLHDLMERLRTLQQQDVTEEQRDEWMVSWETCSGPKIYRDMIAAAVRVIVADHFVDANKKEDDE